jgi:hypothetical protein
MSVLDAETATGQPDDASDDAATGEGGTPRRRTGAATTALLTTLKSENYFTERRTLGDVKGALGQKGHTLKSQDISPVLVRLTQDGVLKREKNPAKQWVYFAS